MFGVLRLGLPVSVQGKTSSSCHRKQKGKAISICHHHTTIIIIIIIRHPDFSLRGSVPQ